MVTKTFHRRNLPHLHYDEGTYFITYRLADTIPLPVLEQYHEELSRRDLEDLNIKQKKFFKKYDTYLDNALHGHDYLTKKEFARIIINTLHYPEGKEYFLICYCIMPNHVHLVFRLLKLKKGISKIMQSIKEFPPWSAINY